MLAIKNKQNYKKKKAKAEDCNFLFEISSCDDDASVWVCQVIAQVCIGILSELSDNQLFIENISAFGLLWQPCSLKAS